MNQNKPIVHRISDLYVLNIMCCKRMFVGIYIIVISRKNKILKENNKSIKLKERMMSYNNKILNKSIVFIPIKIINLNV